MKKFLITGAGGFVGKYFLEYLRDKAPESKVLGLDVAPSLEFKGLDFEYQKIDMLDAESVRRIVSGFAPDYIVHLASVSSVAASWKAPVDCFKNNTNIFLNLAESVRELGLGARILSIGSSEEYGNYDAEAMPLREDYELNPNTPYSVARVSQELVSKLYAKGYGLDIVLTRSFNHIGPRQKDIFVIPSFVKQLSDIAAGKSANVLKVGNIDIVRDFLDVRDVVDAYYKILTNGVCGEVYNVCSGEGASLRNVVAKISGILNISPAIEVDSERLRPVDNMVIVGDNSKLRRQLSWSRKYTLEQTLRDMIANLKKDD